MEVKVGDTFHFKIHGHLIPKKSKLSMDGNYRISFISSGNTR